MTFYTSEVNARNFKEVNRVICVSSFVSEYRDSTSFRFKDEGRNPLFISVRIFSDKHYYNEISSLIGGDY